MLHWRCCWRWGEWGRSWMEVGPQNLAGAWTCSTHLIKRTRKYICMMPSMHWSFQKHSSFNSEFKSSVTWKIEHKTHANAKVHARLLWLTTLEYSTKGAFFIFYWQGGVGVWSSQHIATGLAECVRWMIVEVYCVYMYVVKIVYFGTSTIPGIKEQSAPQACKCLRGRALYELLFLLCLAEGYFETCYNHGLL